MRRIPVLLALALTCFAGCASAEGLSGSAEPSKTLSGEVPRAESPDAAQKGQTEKMTPYDFSDFPNVELIGADLDGMSDEQLAVLHEQARYCQAMTDADTDTLRELVPADATFTHMSGRQQTREEYFADIENGNLQYFTIGIDSPIVTVDGDMASVTFTSRLNANAYGARGAYRMSGTHHWEKHDGKWTVASSPNP